MNRLALALLLATLIRSRASAENVLFAADFSPGASNQWQNVAFFKTLTDYQVRHEGTNVYVAGVAIKSCSAWSTKISLTPPARLKLRWRWRIGGVVPHGSERDLKKFDHAARVFVAFDTFIGPPRTLNYLWGNVEPAGAVLAHPKSSRAEIFVVESGNDKARQWVAEERDVTADWNRAFPGLVMPKIVGVGVMTDGDSLGIKLTGDYADIALFAE